MKLVLQRHRAGAQIAPFVHSQPDGALMPLAVKGVLIIDDECLIADYVATVLEEEGIAVAGTAASAAEARVMFNDLQPSALVCDIRLGSDDGVELARELRAQRDIPVIFVSGFGDQSVLERVNGLAAAGFLQKPVLPQRLVQAVRNMLADAA
jgi:two-component system, response regulator PdtaR